jgi:hypothetical protein
MEMKKPIGRKERKKRKENSQCAFAPFASFALFAANSLFCSLLTGHRR